MSAFGGEADVNMRRLDVAAAEREPRGVAMQGREAPDDAAGDDIAA
jgi:hypothetical protein